MRFVLPHSPQDRPAWLVRLGLFLYDHLGGRKKLPGTRTLNLRRDPEGAPILDQFTRGFEYSDCWVDDARLVVLNAVGAAEKGALVLTRSPAVSARRENGAWTVVTKNAVTGETRTFPRPLHRQLRRALGFRRDRARGRVQFHPQRAAREGQPHHRAEMVGGLERLSGAEHRQAGDLHQPL